MKIQLIPAMLLLSAACSATAFAQAAPATDKMADKAAATGQKMQKKSKDAMAPAADAAAPAMAVKKAKKAPMVTASAAEIADAKAKGLVWVNTGTGVYHKDGEFFGATKQGKFMTEADAQAAKYRAAKMPGHSDKMAKSTTKMAMPAKK